MSSRHRGRRYGAPAVGTDASAVADLVELAEGLLESFFGIEFPKADIAGCNAAIYNLGQLAGRMDRVQHHVADAATGVTEADVGRSVTAFHRASSQVDQRFGELSTLARELA